MTIQQDLITPNNFSRSQEPLTDVRGLVLHWVASPGQLADETRDYFEMRKNGKLGYGSAHFIVGLNGEIVQCIPTNEVAFHVGSSQPDPASGKIYTDLCRAKLGAGNPNYRTIGIEHNHTDWSGKFEDSTLHASVQLAAKLCLDFKLDPLTQIFIHQQIVGWKQCPLWFVNHPSDLNEYRQLVAILCKTLKR